MRTFISLLFLVCAADAKRIARANPTPTSHSALPARWHVNVLDGAIPMPVDAKPTVTKAVKKGKKGNDEESTSFRARLAWLSAWSTGMPLGYDEEQYFPVRRRTSRRTPAHAHTPAVQ